MWYREILFFIILVFSFILTSSSSSSVFYNNIVTVGSNSIDSSIVMGNNNTQTASRPSLDDYLKKRKSLVFAEFNRSLGSDIVLSSEEKYVNDLIMEFKLKEYDIGFTNPYKFIPSRHFFESLKEIEHSNVFKVLREMPKGAILHAHDMALCSTDYLIKITYRENLWQYTNIQSSNIEQFRFSLDVPGKRDANKEWRLVQVERNRLGSDEYDRRIRKKFSLYTDNPLQEYRDINDVWTKFVDIFKLVQSLITYEPVWKEYFEQALEEFYEDGVQYLEFRGLLPEVYDLTGRTYSLIDKVQIYKDVADEFIKQHTDFIGVKFIYAPIKRVSDTTIEDYMKNIQDLMKKYPTFIAGFDLVGQEDLGRPLFEVVEQLLQLPNDVKFFFHAGETNWYGTTSDENLIDAILLGSHRIGHGYALVKHPELLKIVKEKEIAIEVNPLSNQILKLVEDFRNHPCAIYFSDNYNVVISSDDPSFWDAKPLSHDFYQAFMGIASKQHDLRLLKKLALNSITFSAMDEKEKEIALEKFKNKWNSFINKVIVKFENANLIQ